MDLETVQLLNLSPIPELSEVELSTMLDQLSGFTDLTGELSDRYVEDILKEAEDLIDKSSSSKHEESLDFYRDVEAKDHKTLDEITVISSESKVNFTAKEQIAINKRQEESGFYNNKKHYNSPAVTDDENFQSVSKELSCNNINISPKVSANHIKSTIDSLKEYSVMMEKQINHKSQDFSLISKKNLKTLEDKQPEAKNVGKGNRNSEKIPSKANLETEFSNLYKKKLALNTGSTNKPIKQLSCFERLYKGGFVKNSDKPHKPLVKKKHFQSLKTSFNLKKKQQKGLEQKNDKKVQNKKDPKVNKLDINKNLNKGFLSKDNELKLKNVSAPLIVPFKNLTGVEDENDFHLTHPRQLQHCPKLQANSELIYSSIDGNLIQNLLKEVKIIKDQLKKAGVKINIQHLKENQSGIDELQLELKKIREKLTSDYSQNESIKKLENQFSTLKNKYDLQMEKLEAENAKLKEALKNQQKSLSSFQRPDFDSQLPLNSNTNEIHSSIKDFDQSNKTLTRSFSLESCLATKNFPCFPFFSSVEDIHRTTKIKEAFSQTEKNQQNKSVQCIDEDKKIGKLTFTKNETKAEEESKKKSVENKENITEKKKLSRNKPFSDVHQLLLKQKKTATDRETQLMATFRGLQAEVAAKDKEARKLKNEIDLLRTQNKRLGRNKVEALKKHHVGSQTVGLWPIVPRPYNPEFFEVPKEYEKENEELKSRIKALEEDFETLKERRVKDLQSLHQVHEEEMTKVISKLDTQSALTKHLYSLLVDR